jgi:hypothetical protein
LKKDKLKCDWHRIRIIIFILVLLD